MNGLRRDGLDRAKDLAARIADETPPCEIVICPPATLLGELRGALGDSAIALAGQDCHGADSGANTGDLSAGMLADAGCRYVIVGHSERRADHGETDAAVRAKAAAALGAGLAAIVCLGESAAERDAGRAIEVVETQLAGSLPDGAGAANTVVAYEPVWAIGTGRTPETGDIAAVHGHLRALLTTRLGPAGSGVRILYGGSVKPANAREILGLGDVDGALVGGASLSVDDFWAICRSCP